MNREAELIKSAKAGSLPAFEELVISYEKKIYNYCFRMTNSIEDAEDLTQEVFIRVYRKLGSFRATSKFSSWIYRIAHNLCIDRYRRGRVPSISLSATKLENDQKDMDLPSREQTPEKCLISREQLDLILKCIAMLKPKYRSVIVMRDIQDLAYEEIATILKLPMGTVKSQISRARARLRETIASMLEGGEGA